MARTQTMTEMLANLRAEAGHSLSVAQGSNTVETLKYLLKRTQEELWTAFVWPEMTIRDDIPMIPGTYIYYPSVNMSFTSIREAWAAQPGGQWSPVGYGIGEDLRVPGTTNNSASGDPVQLYDLDSGKFRVWPTPINGGWLRFKGNKELDVFVNLSDKCTLDATAIILFAASELLARSKAEDAANKLQKAQRHLLKLLGNQVNAKNKISTYGSASPGAIGGMRSTAIVGYP